VNKSICKIAHPWRGAHPSRGPGRRTGEVQRGDGLILYRRKLNCKVNKSKTPDSSGVLEECFAN